MAGWFFCWPSKGDWGIGLGFVCFILLGDDLLFLCEILIQQILSDQSRLEVGGKGGEFST